MKTIEFQLQDEIMATDTYISVSSEDRTENEIASDINYVITLLKKFDKNYSRFKKNNLLDQFNNTGSMHVTPEFYDILKTSKFYYELTNKVFDPTILEYLLTEGYNVSKNKGYYSKNKTVRMPILKHNFDEINLSDIKIVTKPLDLKIDLGGIGKGYAVDLVKKYLIEKYTSFCINLGGDIYAQGVDEKNFYNFWAIDIENPILNNSKKMPSLILKNKAVATSGVNKRHWIINGEVKNHIINPKTGESIKNDLLCVTVIGDDCVFADVIAKTLLIMGLEIGKKFADENHIPAIFINNKLNAKITEYAEEYIWK